MAEIVIQDPLSGEVQSPMIAGITEGLNKISAGLEMGTEALQKIKLTPVDGQNPTDPRRIYQVPDGKRLWLKEPLPQVYLNDSLTTSIEKDFSIDYIGGSITFVGEYRPEENDNLTVSFTHIKTLDNVVAKIRTAQSAAETAQGAASAAQSAADNAQSDATKALQNIVPVGTITWFSGSTPPEGFLACNGAAVSRSTYSALFAAISSTYGNGDGSSTFNVPDLRDRVAWGGTSVGSKKEAGLPNITGSVMAGPTGYGGISGAFAQGSGSGGSAESGSGKSFNAFSFDASRSSAIYGKSTTVQPPALTLLPCIKY